MRELILGRTWNDAYLFARVVHRGQKDKAGWPYLCHIQKVQEGAATHAASIGLDHDACAKAALLHDVIEDTPYDAAHLRREGFSEGVVSAVEWLTKPKAEPYATWIDRLCADAPLIALIVKLADLEDNLRSGRLGKLDAATQDRLRQKYEPAREKVRAAIQAQASPRA